MLQVELDMPNRTTRDYEGPQVAPRVQAALDAALQDEEDLDLEVQPAVFSARPKAKGKKEKVRTRYVFSNPPLRGSCIPNQNCAFFFSLS